MAYVDGFVLAVPKKNLAAYKVPVRVDIRFVELPRNASGKILKSELRQDLAPAES